MYKRRSQKVLQHFCLRIRRARVENVFHDALLFRNHAPRLADECASHIHSSITFIGPHVLSDVLTPAKTRLLIKAQSNTPNEITHFNAVSGKKSQVP